MGFTDFMVSISEAPQIKLLDQLGELVTLSPNSFESPQCLIIKQYERLCHMADECG